MHKQDTQTASGTELPYLTLLKMEFDRARSPGREKIIGWQIEKSLEALGLVLSDCLWLLKGTSFAPHHALRSLGSAFLKPSADKNSFYVELYLKMRSFTSGLSGKLKYAQNFQDLYQAIKQCSEPGDLEYVLFMKNQEDVWKLLKEIWSQLEDIFSKKSLDPEQRPRLIRDILDGLMTTKTVLDGMLPFLFDWSTKSWKSSTGSSSGFMVTSQVWISAADRLATVWALLSTVKSDLVEFSKENIPKPVKDLSPEDFAEAAETWAAAQRLSLLLKEKKFSCSAEEIVRAAQASPQCGEIKKFINRNAWELGVCFCSDVQKNLDVLSKKKFSPQNMAVGMLGYFQGRLAKGERGPELLKMVHQEASKYMEQVLQTLSALERDFVVGLLPEDGIFFGKLKKIQENPQAVLEMARDLAQQVGGFLKKNRDQQESFEWPWSLPICLFLRDVLCVLEGAISLLELVQQPTQRPQQVTLFQNQVSLDLSKKPPEDSGSQPSVT